MTRKAQLLFFIAVVLGIGQFVLMILASSWMYTVGHLELARREGIYSTPEQGMRQRIAKAYQGIQKIEIEHAGTNSFDGSDPHVGFVVAKVWADRHSDGSAVGNGRHNYEYPGSFYLHVKEGWIHMPEGAFPEFIGFWMKVYGLAGG